MGASITLAGESLIAQKQGAQQILTVSRFILANVPGLDPNGPVDRAAGKPAAGQIVGTFDVTDAGYVNPNQVVYSLMMGSDIGDFDWNWIGLETAENVLLMVAYVPTQQKRRNIPPLQLGNNVTRNFLVVFDGAQALTGLTIDASTWQHDFTVRLAGIDERERQSNRDMFGRACFFGSALQLEKVGAVYQLRPGTAYVEGVRLQRAAALPVVPPAFPTTAWLDVALQREMSDVVASWSVVWGAGKVDYVDSAGVQHYCVAIADLPNSNTITDSRPVENIAGPLVEHFASVAYVAQSIATRQPVHNNLTSFAGLAGAADKLPYFTGAGALSLTTLSAFARTLLDDANATAALATLGAAPLASPGFTGTPTAPTAALAANNTQLANTAFVKAAIAALVDSSPGALDTLNELAAALGDDPNFATTMTNALAGKQPLDATLTALAALATAADKLIYSTGSDQFATSTLTAKARALLASVDESAMRTFLQLVKQTSVIDTTTGAMLSVGSFGIGKSVDLRQTIYVTGTPADLFGKGFAIGFADGGESGLAIPGLAGYIYGTLTVSVPYSDGSGRPSYHREFKTGGRTFTQYAANDVAWSAWVETWHSGNLTPADLPPPGAVVHFARNSAPSGWIKANGAAVSRTSYAALYAAIGTTFGAGDGSTTFNLPDLRGEFLRGWDDGRGVDSGRAFASAQGDQLQEHNHGGSGQLGNVAGGSGEYVFNGVNGAATPIGSNYTPVNGNVGNFGAETRPRNIALLACIKY